MWRAVAVILAMLTSSAQAQNKATLDSVSVHLFLEKSGTLSPDVTTIPNFKTWNFAAVAEGIPQDEHFRAILIKLRITAPGEHFAKGKVAELTLTNRETKKVVKRARVAGIYIGPEGAIFVPVLVEDAACGPFNLVVTGGAKRITKSLEINCGE
jgi:hypothetical protein